MTADKEQIEQPGINAIDHPCEFMVELPLEEGEDKPVFKRCRILAKSQCSECASWVCGTEELEHSIICARCDKTFCPEHWSAHKASKECELEITDEDVKEFTL